MRIVITGKTPSANNLYSTNKWGQRFMLKAAKDLKAEIIEEVMNQVTNQGYVQPEWLERLLRVSVTVHEDWFTKKHTIKKKDIANKEKFVIDCVMDGMRLDDSQIWHNTLIKIQEDNPEEYYTIIELEFYKP